MDSKSKVFYVQLEPSAFLTDPQFIAMTADQKGLYWTVILLLYQNKGRLKIGDPGIRRAVHWTECDSSWPEPIQDLHSSFYQRGAWLRHRRVDKELKKAQAAIQQRVNAANSRWNKDAAALRPHSARIQSKGNEKKGKEGKIESSKTGFSADFLPRYDDLADRLKPRNKSDETMLRQIVFYISHEDHDWDRVYAIAHQSQKATKPMAYFCQSIKSEFGDYKNVSINEA